MSDHGLVQEIARFPSRFSYKDKSGNLRIIDVVATDGRYYIACPVHQGSLLYLFSAAWIMKASSFDQSIRDGFYVPLDTTDVYDCRAVFLVDFERARGVIIRPESNDSLFPNKDVIAELVAQHGPVVRVVRRKSLHLHEEQYVWERKQVACWSVYDPWKGGDDARSTDEASHLGAHQTG